MVGLPGTGKSTLVNGMYDIENMVLYSTDKFIEDAAKHFGLTYDESFKDNIDHAIRSMNEMLDIAIRSKQDIAWDQTNLGVGKRKKIINRMKQAGYQVRCKCILPPTDQELDEWKTRLANRPGKTIPQGVIDNMQQTYVIPSIEEGFDMIAFYNMSGAFAAIDYFEEKE
jgi:predicted kinase